MHAGIAPVARTAPGPRALARHALPGTSLLAWRNLAHDRARFVVTLIGIAFSVVLMGVQLALLVGFAKTASGLIDHADADLWISAAGTTNVDIAAGISRRWRHQALATPGVADATDLMVQFAFWKKPDGGTETVIMVGYDLASGRGAPWALAEGRSADLLIDGGVFIDRLYRDKLGAWRVGDRIEISQRRARVVGFTDGIRTFTQSPYVFTTHARAQRYTFFADDRTTYVLVKLAPGAKPDAVRAALAERMPELAVWTREAFARQTQRYWLVTTGAGAALLLAALLGLIVGIVIVGQTLYASTIDHLPEYATLRAIGAGTGYLHEVILKQAAISALLGFALGFAATLAVALATSRGNIAVALPWWLVLLLAALTTLMCMLGALFSIRRVTRIDPTTVFA